VVTLSLSLDDGGSGEGGAQVYELEASAGVDCVAGVILADVSAVGGVCMLNPAFVDRSIGTASTILDPLLLSWSSTDPGANCGEVTDQWTGTYEIAEWVPERVVLNLLGGTHCPYGDTGSCSESDGSLIIEGLRAGPEPASPGAPAYMDFGSGQPICSGVWP
jgi:hypothetical protein